MDKSKIKVTVTMGAIIDSGNWLEYCDKYGINIYCIAEGLADRNTETEISLKDAKNYDLIEDDK